MLSPSATRPNPVIDAIDRAIERLQLAKVTAPNPIRIYAGPSDFLGMADAIRTVLEIYNDYVRAIGDEVEANSPFPIDGRCFAGVFTDASSDAIFACETIAERLQDEREVA